VPVPDAFRSTPARRRGAVSVACVAATAFAFILIVAKPAVAQSGGNVDIAPPEQEVAVEPGARDEAIGARISRILQATGWFRTLSVAVDQGVVFLDGVTTDEDHRQWARELAGRTEDVVAVVNRLEVREEVAWDLAPVVDELERLARRLAVALPLVALSVLILPLAWVSSSALARLLRRLLAPSVEQDFLRSVIARTIAIPVFLLGVYVVLQFAGLTGLAVSLLGGAGILGVVLGFAFRDIAENFLASLILSLRRPFRQGDVIAVAGHEGVVQTMNTRSTVLLTIDGNHVQIPNATVFKSTIVNFTAAPARRVTADVGVGYDATISEVQDIIVAVLCDHEAILDTPPPMVLVEALGASTVKLNAHFWIDGRAASPLRVRSSALRLIKSALEERGVSMPDEAREVIFPQGVPIVRHQGAGVRPPAPVPPRSAEATARAISAEGGLGSEISSYPTEVADGTIPEASSDNLLGSGPLRSR
jgi:small-conductance mechanosensitive channel